MENGTYRYDIEMSTPLGKRRGNLELMVWNHFLNGYLTMFTRTIPIQNGRCVGNKVSFGGDMKTLMKMLPYLAEGTLSPSGVELMIETQQGSYRTTGILTEVRRDTKNG